MDFDGGLNFVKRWVAAEEGNRLSAFGDVGAAFIEKM